MRTLAKLVLGGAAVVALLFGITLALLFYADYDMAGNASPDPRARAAWVWERGDHFHYAGHLIIGRVLDLCPCARNAAGARYYYARFHAVTPRQKAVVENSRPASPGQFAAYVTGPFMVWLDWVGDGVAWLGGQRPAKQVLIALDQYEFAPAELRIPRGTTVVWRNVDDLGEAHTVTAAPHWLVSLDSDFLVPGEEVQFTFTERGEFVFFCREHGEPLPIGMAGRIIVE